MTDQTGLGRRISLDDRDHQYLMPRRTAEAAAITHRYWWSPPAFDQGATPQCVAYAGVRWLVSSPVRNQAIPFAELYKACQQNDEWPGEDYEGTSVRGLFKVFKAKGLVSGYQWAFDAEPVVNHLLTTGPVVVGTSWTDEMANPRLDGYVIVEDLKSDSIGGHAWYIDGANRNKLNPDGSRGAIRAVNSWGPNWGQHGRFWMSFSDLNELLAYDGEACVATEVLKSG